MYIPARPTGMTGFAQAREPEISGSNHDLVAPEVPKSAEIQRGLRWTASLDALLKDLRDFGLFSRVKL